jgi:hypothetical protein
MKIPRRSIPATGTVSRRAFHRNALLNAAKTARRASGRKPSHLTSPWIPDGLVIKPESINLISLLKSDSYLYT